MFSVHCNTEPRCRIISKVIRLLISRNIYIIAYIQKHAGFFTFECSCRKYNITTDYIRGRNTTATAALHLYTHFYTSTARSFPYCIRRIPNTNPESEFLGVNTLWCGVRFGLFGSLRSGRSLLAFSLAGDGE